MKNGYDITRNISHEEACHEGEAFYVNRAEELK